MVCSYITRSVRILWWVFVCFGPYLFAIYCIFCASYLFMKWSPTLQKYVSIHFWLTFGWQNLVFYFVEWSCYLGFVLNLSFIADPQITLGFRLYGSTSTHVSCIPFCKIFLRYTISPVAILICNLTTLHSWCATIIWNHFVTLYNQVTCIQLSSRCLKILIYWNLMLTQSQDI